MRRLMMTALILVALTTSDAQAARHADPVVSIIGPTTLSPGDRFSVAWSASPNVRYPYGYAECPGTGWASYRFNQGDGTIGVFELASADPAFVFPPGTWVCSVELIDRDNVIAIASFVVGA